MKRPTYLRFRVALYALCTMVLAISHAAHALESFAPVVERSLPAVVNISTKQKMETRNPLEQFNNMPEGEENKELHEFFKKFGMPFGAIPHEEREVNSLGSGFIIAPEGYVVTNNHVIAEASEIFVILHDETKLPAKLVGRDSKTDLALLKVESKRPLPYVELGNSDKMRVGDWVIAIGNPFGLGNTVTAGIISARSRNINAGPFDDFLQTDAAINRGNSGGPMFNQDGEVIGVNTAIYSPSGGSVGIGFAIPTALAKPVLQQLRETGRTHRGWLGVKIQHMTEEMAQSLGLEKARGALVLEATPNAPATVAGVLSGDIILSFDGKEINEMRALPRIVAETPVGKKVSITVWRKGERKIINLTLGEYPEEQDETPKDTGYNESEEQEKGEILLGMRLRDTTQKDDKKIQGVLITFVDPQSTASQRAVAQGDVIVGVNQEAITTLTQFKTALDAARQAGRKFILIRIQRGTHSSYVTLPLDEPKAP
ncbi:MAG: DegQ family serine endoprotease [Alphaproteobacteria bacterium]|nr:MAG: DegQ family serine endoprotease [Alphaproteobacteria bacterium]TAF14203.1 MAG: DegQ family serine endoprotease [Alphaproteobacteria bacterium]TAF39325.1 MAG: DegQ family serine endoprotease [Alphaproteobacteria bacterium]TAF76912.1 MAG: DegQ family serine endoprotease [Alphaproteobacteria bacterium]